MSARQALAATSLVLVLVLLVLATSSSGNSEQESVNKKELPKLFNFEFYKNAFGKHYDSLSEEVARKRLFFSRAFNAFVVGVKYKFYRSSHYNAINHLSDLTPEEIRTMRNKVMMEMALSEMAASETDELSEEPAEHSEADQLPEFIPDENEDVERELEQLVDDYGDKPELEDLRRAIVGDTKRSSKPERRLLGGNGDESADDIIIEQHRPMKVREFSLDMLVADTSAGSDVKFDDIESNNPFYEAPEVSSYGLSDQEERPKFVNVRKKDERVAIEQLIDYLKSWRDWWYGIEPEEPLFEKGDGRGKPDRLFVDLRRDKCLAPIRNQGRCGSCYAFATMSIMEYIHCKKTGRLVPFSEQYMLDCGKGRFRGMLAGCEGGSLVGVARFIHNWGQERRKVYPYRMRDGRCPYHETHDLKKTGYVRMEVGSVAHVSSELWHEALKSGPIYLQVSTGDDFENYGGGVYSGAACERIPNHAMVLVGHGRQNGQEYWLIRNSYSVRWGERGYWKLAKKATAACIPMRYGSALGTNDGINYHVEPKIVDRNAELDEHFEELT